MTSPNPQEGGKHTPTVPVRELAERLVGLRDRTAERADRDLLADVANRLIELDRDLEYAYAKVRFGFEHGSFDFSVLRARALQATGGENGR